MICNPVSSCANLIYEDAASVSSGQARSAMAPQLNHSEFSLVIAAYAQLTASSYYWPHLTLAT